MRFFYFHFFVLFFLPVYPFCIIFAHMKHLFLHILFTLILGCWCLEARAQYSGTFQVNVKCGGRDIPVTFSRHSKRKEFASVGEGKYGSPANDTTAAGRIVIPDSVSDAEGARYRVFGVNRYAFGHCARLTEVVLPDSLQEIGDQAFVRCTSLREVTLPKSLRVIYPFAFADCKQLNIIRLHAAKRPSVYNDIFDQQTLSQATLVIPAGTASDYKNSLVFGMFRYMMEDFDQ